MIDDSSAPRPDDSAERRGSVAEVGAAFLRLGCVSFGGPVAHLAYFRAELVTKRRWLEDARYSDLVGLCQFLPGPASSQVAFALGMHRAGFWGAVVASLCFTLPSAVLMILFAQGVAQVNVGEAGWIHGMKTAAVAVVAQAVWGMGRTLCPDRQRVSLCFAAAAALLLAPGAFMQLVVIALGGLAGYCLYGRGESTRNSRSADSRHHLTALAALGAFAGFLGVLPVLAAGVQGTAAPLFDRFYRSGALVFGGGHVVLPLLRAELVPSGFLTDDRFLAGYGVAQAMPGPLFSFSGYLGAAIAPDRPWLIGLLCVFALFLPGWLLIGGALPFWHRLRELGWVKAALAGTNASVVGILLAALYSPVFTEGVRHSKDAALAAVGFLLLEYWKCAPWLLVLGSAFAGHWLGMLG